ncbi:hypothetical protein [Streptomyces sp. NPDC058694]|uniref:hypothetical protein n=1 Tax=Streptomyces sp. NPDC058694 TaxID=3346603 RepID=UPI00365B03D5
MAIEWDRIGQVAFDRHVEALLHRMYDGKAIAVNGRGGDQGIDVRVSTDAGLRIFQLKYHPDGFPGTYRGRRPAIKKSFLRAMQHDPVEWTLVVPCTLTASERAFVDRLAVGRTVKVSVMDRPALDDAFAVHSSLEATFTRDQAREAARDFGREQALLVDGDDLIERVRALGNRVDNVDPNWTWDFQRRGDTVIQTLRAQHALAFEVSPVRLSLETRPEAMDAGLTAAFTRALGYGTAEEIELPPEAVASLTIDGPEWLSKTVSDVRVIWQPVPDVVPSDAAAEVEFLDSEGTPTGRYAGRLIAHRSGELGASVEADIHAARLQMLLPFDQHTEGMVRYSFDLTGREPAEAMRVLRLHQRILRGGSLRISVDGTEVGSGQLSTGGTEEDYAEVEKLLSYLSDLEVVQHHCESYFPAPLVYSGAERIDLRIARLLIEGRCVADRSAHTVTATLNGLDSPELRTALGPQPQSLRFGGRGFEVTIGGRALDIGAVYVFHPRVIADNGEQTIAALRTGRVAGTKVVFRPQDGEHFRLYLADAPGNSRSLAPVSLGLRGYTDPR